jgi:TnpA family transposase
LPKHEEIGRIERTLFMLDWFRDPALRRRVQAGLNKGKPVTRWRVRYSCTGWVKSGTENRKIRAIAPVDWRCDSHIPVDTVYMERAVDALKRKG